MDFISRNTGVFACPVSHFLRITTINRLRFGNLDIDDNWDQFLNFCQHLFNTGVGSYALNIRLNQKQLRESKKRNVFVILDFVVAQLGFQGTDVLIKENLVFEFLPALIASGRVVSVVYQVRNPICCVSSFMRSPNHHGSLVGLSKKWCREQQAFMRSVGYVTDFIDSTLLRYEDVVNAPKEYSQKIKLKFPSMTCSNKRSSARLDFETKIENHKLVDGAVRANRNKIAFENLSNDQIRQIQGVCGDLMQLFGYAKAGRATVNLYPDWLIEQPISDLINLKMNSQLSQSEQELRSERHRLIDTIISRQIPSPDFL